MEQGSIQLLFCFGCFPRLAVAGAFDLFALGSDEKWKGRLWCPSVCMVVICRKKGAGTQLQLTLFSHRGLPLSPIRRFLSHPSFRSQEYGVLAEGSGPGQGLAGFVLTFHQPQKSQPEVSTTGVSTITPQCARERVFGLPTGSQFQLSPRSLGYRLASHGLAYSYLWAH